MAITSPIDQATAPEAAEAGRRARWLAAIRDFARHRTLGAVGAVVVLVMLVFAVFAGVLAPYDPVAVDFGAMLAAPNGAHRGGQRVRHSAAVHDFKSSTTNTSAESPL